MKSSKKHLLISLYLSSFVLPLLQSTTLSLSKIHSDRIRTAVNVLSDGYVSGIVAHLSKDELEKYDREHGGIHPELAPALGHDSQGKSHHSSN